MKRMKSVLTPAALGIAAAHFDELERWEKNPELPKPTPPMTPADLGFAAAHFDACGIYWPKVVETCKCGEWNFDEYGEHCPSCHHAGFHR